ncbi:DUF7351 domain-containing protein [Natronobacterium texcoconense]|uniref:Uncharacterized protein n=1 Tax=Natronobacterium texcoconense TaxID=1095778 RepID=A0A1H1IEI3_NATTX|nr:helix-turn-helix transcriptional regulator [Natronobacterium texcoconense]SDR35746.1 hypothetical protein SAMN04489842_3461 [Natronobacterium texcoconense]
MDREQSDSGGLAPADAFSLLGHDLRVDILRGLLELSRTRAEYPASFSTLRERVGADVSSQFNYHLDELTGHFVRRTDDGYELRYAGWEVATSILAGTYNRRAAFGPTEIDGRCPHCTESSLAATYREEWLTVECPTCNERLVRYPFPPGGLESRSLSEVLEAFDRHVRSHVALARDGICPGCTGPVTVQTATDADLEGERIAIFVCQRCGNRLRPHLGLALVADEHVVQFARSHGRSLSKTRFWELEWCVSDAAASVSTDPWRCTVPIPIADETLVLTVDDELVVRSTRIDDGEIER